MNLEYQLKIYWLEAWLLFKFFCGYIKTTGKKGRKTQWKQDITPKNLYMVTGNWDMGGQGQVPYAMPLTRRILTMIFRIWSFSGKNYAMSHHGF